MSSVVLDKVRKLLAKAEDPACTAEEAAAFTDKAAELIAKYGVDRALLAARDPASDSVGDRIVAVAPPYALDKVGLLVAVASALRCRSVRRTGEGHRGFSVHLFGYGSDLERVELLFTSLLVQPAYGLAAGRAEGGRRRVAEVYPRLAPVGPRRLTGSGLRAGMAAGERADLGGGRIRSGARAPAVGA
jgi:hypothetical protein